MQCVKTKRFAIFELVNTPVLEKNAKKQKSESVNSVDKKGGTGKPKEPKESSKKTSVEETVKAATTAQAPKSFVRRDHLRKNEIEVQQKWDSMQIYNSNADPLKPKFFVTFPYPYMNGRLHLGHAFSLTKAEFTARFQTLLGKNVLWPFAFHCTGMPIQAAANKLKEEIKQFGNPPIFPDDEIEASVETEEPEEKSAEAQIAAKSKGSRSKLVMKGLAGTKVVRQWNILEKMVPIDEIAAFTDPIKWLEYFPPYGATDLQAFGSAIDWRRSFITTSVNPFYDAFIRWQFNHLKEGNRIKFGKRANVYSPLDGQVCADHDRSSGEGVGPQEYTIIKLLVITPYPDNSPLNCDALQGKNIYLAPATLRPETMYGQTNCFVLPEGDYGAYELTSGDVLIVSHRAAIGLAHQGYMATWGTSKPLATMKGTDLLGLPLKAPNAIYERVYTLPLLTISMGKGTGVVTSVPSDAPDDYAALKELQDKPLWREKFGLTAEMVDPFAVVPIIEIEGYGNMSAVVMCERLDIKSSKDTEKLKKAKEEVYMKGFYEGVMLVGQCKGMKVCDAKPVIRQALIDSGDALSYYEPESTVMSRSGDECVVALTDQWYLAYGDSDWMQAVLDHIHSKDFSAYNEKNMERFDFVLGWLKEWACSRQFGLGTLLPWDQKWVIESLSDSTIYMAYYTIAHIIHGSVGNLTGINGPHHLTPEQFTDDIFDFIFLHKDKPVSSTIPDNLLEEMQKEFQYWYPLDLRVSAKDLIPNHLTMCLYNHVEIWKDYPQYWPRGIYCNGHVMVDAEKMSKNKGNFLLLLDVVEEFTADATRFALADAGDTLEDANFDRSVANQAITYLFNEEEWILSVLSDADSNMLREGDLMFMDKSLLNELNYLIEATLNDFEAMRFRDGLHRGWFDMIIARDMYRDWAIKCNIAMHKETILKFIEALVIMIAPVCPHWSDGIYSRMKKNATISVCKELWPVFVPFDKLGRKQYLFFREFLKNARQAAIKAKLTGSKSLTVYLASSFEEKRIILLKFLQSQCDSEGNLPEDLLKRMKEYLESSEELKKDTKVLMQFGAFMRDEAKERGLDALAEVSPFDQEAILKENRDYILKALDLVDLSLEYVDSNLSCSGGDKKKMETAVPGKPSFHFKLVV